MALTLHRTHTDRVVLTYRRVRHRHRKEVGALTPASRNAGTTDRNGSAAARTPDTAG